MSQNFSSAVMQQRHEAHDSLDDFPTPPWATRALCEWIANQTSPQIQIVREPAANRGHMARPLAEYFKKVIPFDVHNYGVGYEVRDFLFDRLNVVDWTITNPPFRLAEQFIHKALDESKYGVAMLVRSAFLEGQGRYERLFKVHPPSDILQFTERVVMHKGKLSPNGSTATAYCWVVWRKLAPSGTHFHWIAPCRKRLERDSDYVVVA